jgi:hypothetical protein
VLRCRPQLTEAQVCGSYGDASQLEGLSAQLTRPPVLHRLAWALYRAALVPDGQDMGVPYSDRAQVLVDALAYAMLEAETDAAHHALAPQHLASAWRKALRQRARELPWLEPLTPYLEAQLHAAMADGDAGDGGASISQSACSFDLRSGVMWLGGGGALQGKDELEPDARAELCRALLGCAALVGLPRHRQGLPCRPCVKTLPSRVLCRGSYRRTRPRPSRHMTRRRWVAC